MIGNIRKFSKKDHHYEFQRMLRIACETHGNELFEEGELQGYLELILEGPEDEQEFVEYYKSWRGEAPPEGAFEQRRKYFHRSQLHPFAAVLYGKYNDYYETLENKSDQKEITDDDYYPTPSRVRSGTVVFRSPKSIQEMETVLDEDLFQSLEEWNDPKNVISVDEDDVYINHDALSATFKQHFLNVISKDTKRVRWWLEKTKLFSRPIFCKAIVDALSELISLKQHGQINDFFDFCEWILSHEDTVPQTGWHEDREDADPDRPSWSSSRSAVRSFAARCISENAGLSQDWRERIFALYRELCTGKNAYLDGKDNNKNKRSGRDLISTAINNTRSQALEDLLRYADWVRKAAGKNCEVSEVVNVIEARLAGNPPLTDAERALLAMHFDNLRWLDAEWTKTHVPDIFDRKDPKLWQACFSAYITHSRGYLNDFDYLKPEYLHALRTVTLDGESDENGHERDSYVILKWMGYRLLIFYLWEKIEMKDSSNLCLELFYEATQRKKELWGDLFNHIGNSLTRWGSDVDEKVIARVKQLFEWRFEQAEPKELADYLFWLGGKCLEPEWRMDGLLRTLPFLDDEDVKASMITDALHKHFLESHPEKTVECFAKVIEAAVKKPYFYIRKESAIPILKTGLVSQNTKTKAFAEEARENLLKAGLFEYLHL